MAKTFFFYDLETSGLDPRNDRIMQFAGIRTDMELNPIGEPYNVLVELADDTLPSPRAVLVTGITPQKTREEGYSEADFARLLAEEVFTADTITVGFNNVRFDDEFIRYLFWRTFRDPYEWAWREGRSRWDLLDVVRITRALRPNGIKWPVDKDGKAVNKLELLTRENGLSHEKAHDALSDVEALIAVTALIKSKQPKLFSYLLKMRDKKLVQELVNLENKQPFVYCSGRYQAEFEKTTVAIPLTTGRHGNVVVYDLRYSPADFAELSVKDLSANIFADSQARRAKSYQPVPIKELVYNKCPAVAPVGVLEELNGWERIGLDEQTISKHCKILLYAPDFAEKIRSVFEDRPEFTKQPEVEAQLYDGFIGDRDRIRATSIVNANDLADMRPDFDDERLTKLLHHYKARNYTASLTEDERISWDQWRLHRITSLSTAYMDEIQELSTGKDINKNTIYLLDELKLWLESIIS